jgi:hypothetical protein
MRLRTLLQELLTYSDLELDVEIKISLDTKDKNYKKGCDMTPDIEEVFHSGDTLWLRTWSS